VAIIGGGPVGLAAAAHALDRDLTPIVLEAGDNVGQAVREWSHVRMFSHWGHNVDKAAELLLHWEGWNAPDPDHHPTGAELVEHYLEPLATRTHLRDHVHCSGHRRRAGRVREGKDRGSGQGAIRDSLPQRQRAPRHYEPMQ
jgi:cation diffusion facilitator CzcD-associated flavoprotein CzcO